MTRVISRAAEAFRKIMSSLDSIPVAPLAAALVVAAALFAVFRYYLAGLEHPLRLVRFATQLQDESRHMVRLRWWEERRTRCFWARDLRRSTRASKRCISALRYDGACVVHSVLTRDLAAKLGALVDESVTTALKAILSGHEFSGEPKPFNEFSQIDGFSPAVLEEGTDGTGLRLQRRLPLSAPVREAMRHSLSSLGPVLRSTLGPKAMMCELACIVANPGAPHQTFHRDAGEMSQPGPGMVSVFIALQDVTCEMGPTVYIPRTHSDEAMAADQQLREAEERYLDARKRAIADISHLPDAESAARAYKSMNRAPLLRAGDALVYDSRLRHCGSANICAEPRLIFNFGFAADGADEAGLLEGHTATLCDELIGVCSLDDDPSEWLRELGTAEATPTVQTPLLDSAV